MRVLVTSGETRPALAITRSLGSKGHEVTVVAERHPSLASISRFCAARESCANPQRFPEDFARGIVEIARRRRIELLLPVNEIATSIIARCRNELPDGCYLPLPPDSSLELANDKGRVLELAERSGVPIPRTVRLDAGQAPPRGLPYPVAFKTTRSRVRTQAGWVAGGTDYALDRRELAAKLAGLPAALFPILVQERIFGTGVGVFACYWNGCNIAMFSHRRLREKPPSGGVSVLCESAPLDPVAAGHAGRLLSALHWHGVAMVEFKRDDRDGVPKLMEINGRFWGSLQLAIDAGVDFPDIVARLASGATMPPACDYRVGVRSRWFLGDLDSLLALWARSSAELKLPRDHPGRWRTLGSFLNCWHGVQRSEVLRRDDFRPGLLELYHWLRGS